MLDLQTIVKTQAKVYPGNIIKVDSFLNHQVDPKIIEQIAHEIHRYFQAHEVTKILTIEASGIAPALMVSQKFDVPMLFAKKALPKTLDSELVYRSSVHSYTKNITSEIVVSKEFLTATDKVLIVDDFLANGEAAMGLVDLVSQAGATVTGVGIFIEKSFQAGRNRLEAAELDVFSACRIASLEENKVKFVEQ